jgi:hypothetical protein
MDKKRILIIMLVLTLLCLPCAMAYGGPNWSSASAAYAGYLYKGDLVQFSEHSNACTIDGLTRRGPESGYTYEWYFYRSQIQTDFHAGGVTTLPTLYPPSTEYNWTGSYYGYNITPTILCSDGQMHYSKWYISVNATRPPANVTFYVSETGSFATKISGASIVISSGQSGTTSSMGNVTISVTPQSSNYTYSVSKYGYQSVTGAPLGDIGINGGSVYLSLTPAAIISNVSIIVSNYDAMNPSSLIAGSTISVKNNTWWNQTATTGQLVVSNSDVGGILPLYIGENLTICGSATGYVTACDNVTIPYNMYPANLYLTKTSQQATNGTWNFVAKVVRNLDLVPITTGHVELTTGVSGPGVYTQYTDDTGSAAFYNISASTSAIVSVVAQGYQTVNYVVTVIPNSTQHATIEMVRIGETPVATPITPAATSTYATVGPTPLPTICDDSGCRTVTTPDDNGLYALIEMAKMLPLWGQMIAGTVTLMLMWGFLYWALGGKYRKRKGWR